MANANPVQLRPGMENTPFNQWYVVAGREEIGRKLLARRMLDQPLVLYRTEDERPVALPDHCPHRFMELSKGKLVGDDVQCPYHGMQFGPDGKCTKIPTQGSVPAAMQVRSFPLIERGLWTWIWMGDAQKADPALIPDTGYVKEHFTKGFQFCFPCRGNFVRLHENLLDTSHPSFLHAGAFDDGDLAESTFKTEWQGQMVRLVRRSRRPVLPGPGTIRTFNLEPGKRVIRTLVTETHAPCLNTIMNTFEYVDEPDRPNAIMVNEFPISPGGPKLCYQFWSTCTSWPMVFEQSLSDYFWNIMTQDDMALQSIETHLTAYPDAAEVSVKADEGAVRFRRMLAAMAAAERTG